MNAHLMLPPFVRNNYDATMHSKYIIRGNDYSFEGLVFFVTDRVIRYET